ncbi:winged helix-turn-helix domain-containing protein [Amycolatopsis jejuensis]|uniref:winged helix-turn-helix domain-containing protein n=1 Tax=Amycolatopsis jejuensis TaxID=330084 RepID=UPI00052772E3|nr:winged helix-turn-helix domain-containing protein [Amycolatopsis jejuensis]
MVLRMVFGPRDLERTRFAAGADPLWELVLAGHQLGSRQPAARYRSWRAKAIRRIADADEQAAVDRLTTIAPPRGDFPDFLTPAPATTDFDAGCAALACTPGTRLRADLERAFPGGRVPTWLRSLGDGEADQVRRLVGSLRTAYRLLVAPVRQRVDEVVSGDRAARLQTVSRQGIGRVLSTLPGVCGWDGTTLALQYPHRRTVDLGGRGLVLVPSAFCTGAPVSLIDPELPPVLVYPASLPPVRSARGLAPLVALVGRTRAECLVALRDSRTTTGLARDLGVSVGTASKHAAVLRGSGLVSTTRSGATAWHGLTELGRSVLAGVGGHPEA